MRQKVCCESMYIKTNHTSIPFGLGPTSLEAASTKDSRTNGQCKMKIEANWPLLFWEEHHKI